MKPILVTSYVNPDLDGVAGAIGYAEFLQKSGTSAVVGIIGEPHDEARYMLDRFGFRYPPLIQNANDYDDVILVDASDLNGLEGKVVPEKVMEVIDHRKVNGAHQFPRAKIQIELVGAAATLVAEKFMKNSTEISKESATLIYCAIISNTLNFKGSVTTERDKIAAEWLNHIASLPEHFWKELFIAKSDLTGTKLAERINGDFAWFALGNKKVGIAQLEIIGAKQLIDTRGNEIIEALEKTKNDMNLDIIFQNTIELDEGRNYLVTDDSAAKTLLENVLGVQFYGIVAERQPVLMRKQIVPLLKEALEK